MPFSSPNSNQAHTFTELLLHAWQSAGFARTFRKPHSHSNVSTLLVLQTEKQSSVWQSHLPGARPDTSPMPVQSFQETRC